MNGLTNIEIEEALENSSELLQLLSESEASYRQLADAMPQIVWTARPDGFLDYYNQRWFDYTGMTLEETEGWGWQPVLHPDDLQNCIDVWSESVRTGERYTVEYRFKRASDGEYRWHLGQALPVCDADGKITKWFGTCTDIHEQKKVVEELRQSQEELELRVKARTAELSVVAATLAGEISERKIVEENLRVREERFQLATRATSDVVWDWDLITDDLWWNRNFQTMFGYSREETGTDINSWTECLHPDDLERVKESVYQSIERGEQSWSDEYRFRRRDNSYAFVADRGYVVYSENGTPLRMVGSMMDITAQKQMETAVKLNEARMTEAQRSARLGDWEFDVVQNKNTWSDELYRIFGLEPQEYDGTFEGYLEFVHPDDLELVKNTFEQAKRDKVFPDVEHRIIGKNGEVRVVHANGIVMSDENGAAAKMTGTLQDITERVEVGNALRRSEEKTRELIENANDIIYTLDLNGGFTSINRTGERITGYTRAEALQMKIVDIIAPQDAEQVRERIAKNIKGAKLPNFELEIIAKDKSIVTLDISSRMIFEDGVPVGIQGIGRDITERKQSEQLIRQSEEKYRSILDTIQESYYELDLPGNMVFFNETLCELTGYSREELEGNSYRKVIDKEYHQKIFDAYNNVFKTGLPLDAVQYQIECKDGTRKYSESSVSLMRNESNQPIGFRGIIRDITERVRAENESEVISEMIQGFSTTSNSDELLELFHRSLKKVLYAENCYVALYDKNTELLNMQFFVDKYDDAPLPSKLGKGLTAYVFRSGLPVLLNRTEIEKLTRQGEIEFIGTAPAVWAGVPLRTPVGIIGVLVVQHYEDENAYNRRDLELLTSVGDQLALAIERKRAEDELRQSQEWLAAMFEASQDGIVVEENDHIVFVNKRFCQMYGCKESQEIIGSHISRFQTPEDSARMVEYSRRRRMGEDVPSVYEFKGVDNNGKESDIEASISTFTSNGKFYIVTAQKDVTERKLAEEALKKETALVELLKTVAIAANESESVEDAIQTCLDKVCQLMKWQYGHAALPAQDSPDELISTPLWYLDQKRFEKVIREMKDIRFHKGIGLIGRVMESGKAIWIKDVTKDPTFTHVKLAKEFGVKASFAFPLLWQSKVLGVLTFFSEKEEEPDEKLLEIMTSIGTQLGQAIVRKQSEKALQLSEERHRLLFESNPQPAFVFDLETFAFIAVNEAAVRKYGYSREEFLSTITVKDIRPPEDIALFLEKVSKVSEDRDVVLSPSRHQKKDGTPFDVEITSHVLNFTGRRAEITLVNDVTERKRAAEAVQNSRDYLDQIINAVADPILVKNRRYEWTLVNDAMCHAMGRSREELIGKTDYDLVPAKEADIFVKKDEEVFTTGEENVYVDEIPDARGETKVTVTRKRLHVDKDGEQFIVAVMRDITEIKRTEEALRKNEAKFRDLFDNAPVAYHELDTEGRFTRINHTEELLLGYTDEELRGRRESDIIVEKISREDVAAKIAGNMPLQAVERTFIRKDGTLVPVLNEDRLIYDEDGKVTGIRSTLQNITERKRIEEELEQTRDAALESARLKSEFLANMSHEIRTPMNGVLGMTGLLLDSSLDVEQRDYAETIQSSADSLLRIIDDILDFSKIEAGQLHFETIDFDLSEAVEGAVEMLAERARIKELELASLVYRDVPTALQSDPGRLRQVLTNLIGNAIKFTETGEVIVSVQKQNETEKYLTLLFEVADTGIGISEAAQQKLFQAFVQADGSTTRKYGGTGLGLAISKQLVEMMGGEIGIKSELGKGSIFWFTARFEKQKKQIPVIHPADDVSLEGLRVLIVDDNATNRRIFVHQTTSWGMAATEAESGAEALSILRAAADAAEPFDIAILDLMMPEMDGFELARLIKSEAAIAATHLVLLPSFGKRGHGQLARDLEIAAYLQKPVRQSQLYSCLLAIITESSVSAAVQQSPRLITQHSLGQASREKKASVESAVMVKVRILVAEDNLVNQKVALKQLQSLGYAADVVSNGREAIEAVISHTYDVVLMDCQMPVADGFEATAAIRRHEGESKHTTIIAMTAHALEGEREKCLAAGMDDYISKPVKIEILGQMLNKWFADDSENRDGAAETENLGTVIDMGIEMDNFESVDTTVLDGFKDLQQPDEPDIVTELIDLFLEDAEKRITILKQSAEGDDVKTINAQAHAIKGSSGNIGALKIATLSNRLEENTIDISRARLIISELEDEFEKVARTLKAMRKADS